MHTLTLSLFERRVGNAKKLLTFLLVVSFALSPLAPVFAQEETSNTEDAATPNATNEATNPEPSMEATPTEAPAQEETNDANIQEGTQNQSSLLSSGEGNNLDVSRYTYDSNRLSDIDELSGTYSFQIPIIVPPGRNGIQPQLALQYSSQPQSEVSEVGYGWSLSIPSIERINKRGTNNMFTDTYFVSSLSGELASTSATTYKAKVENGGFITYTFTNNTWTATDTVGTTYKFGTSTYSRLDHPNNTATTSKWMLEEIRDRNDNYITYSYYKEGGQIYPRSITYTHSTSSTGIFEVEFNRQSRSDTATSSAVGFPINTKERISEIVTKINGTWARKYALAYTTPENRTRSLLASVTEYGRADDGSTTTRPAYNFSYQESGTKGWSTQATWNPPVYLVNSYGESLGTHISDVNGDGWPDLLHSVLKTGIDEQGVYLGTGKAPGWVTASSSVWTFPWGHYFTEYATTSPFFPADVNGDGYDDFIYSATSSSNIYINTGAGWATSTTWFVPTTLVNASGIVNSRIIDVNGDGLPDILTADANLGINEAYLNTGTGWATSTIWRSPQYFFSGTSTDLGVVFLELNGDGLPDMIRSYRSASTTPTIVNVAYLNTGAGWATSTTDWDNPHMATTSGNSLPISNEGHETGFRFVDINGDGGSDIIQGCSCGSLYLPDIMTYLNTNISFATVTNEWNFPSGFTDTRGVDSGGRMLDLDGDFLPDYLGARNEVGGFRVDLNTSNKVDVLTRITYPQGGVTDVTYKTSHEYRDSTTNFPLTTNLAYPILTVATTTDYDSVGNRSTTAYSYEGGKMYWNSPYDRKFAGFNSITKTDPKGNMTKTYYHQASTTESALGEYQDEYAKIGKAYRIEQYDNANNLYAVNINKWDKTDLGNGRVFVKLAENLTLNYEGDSDHRDTLTTFSYASGTGNVVEKINWGEVTGTASGTYTDIGTDKYSTRYTYATNTTYSLTALPSSEMVVDQSGTTVRQSRFYYDLLSLGSTTKGNLTKQEMLKSGSTYIDVEKTYNGFGLVLTEKDPRDKTTTYVYDTYNLYPTTTTNALSQITRRQFDYSSGKVGTTTDPNDRTFVTTYDGFDRPLEEKQPDQTTPSTLVTKSSYVYTDTGFPTSVQRTDYLNTATTTDAYVYVDGFGKKIEERTKARGTNTYTVKDFFYDTRGLVTRESLPYYASSTSYTATSSAPANALFVLYAYDPMGRVKTVGNVVGTTTTTYDDWSATTTDALGNIKSYVKDASGNLVTVGERNGTSTYITEYTYDGNNKLTKITDAELNIRNFTYDLLGRRLTAQDLHDVADGTFGTWTYGYDDASNISTTTDPKSQTVVYTYDDLNRPLTENYTGSAGTEITYTYDTCTDGKGRLCTASTTDARTSYTYTVLGLPLTEQKTLGGTAYTTSYAYDRLGNKTTITYPDSTQAKYTYSSAGQLSAVDYLNQSGTSTSILSNIDYGPHGGVTTQVFGNNAVTVRTYDSNELYRLRSIVTIASSTLGIGEGGSEVRLLETVLGLNDFSELDNNTSTSTPSDPFPTPETNVSEIVQEIPSDVITTDEQTRASSTNETAGTTTVTDQTILDSFPEQVTPGIEPTTTIETTQELQATTSTTTIATSTATTTSIIGNAPITRALQGVNARERAQIKAHELANLTFTEPYLDVEHGLRIEVIGISEIESGVQVYAKAWKNDRPLGFGNDGSVEIERFLIYNPPILVPDKAGDIVQTFTDSISGEPVTRTLREDPAEALMQTLAHIISVKSLAYTDSEITPGKVGNTTSTFYPESDPETTTVDGYTLRSLNNSTWASMRDGAGTGFSDNAGNIPLAYLVSGSASGWSQMYRSFFLFDTSALPNINTVASATISFYGQSVVNNTGNAMEAYIATSSPASSTALASSDHVSVGLTRLSDTDIPYASFTLTGYNNYALNATGRANISKTGISKFGVRGKADFTNVQPADRLPNSSADGLQVWEADQTGTTQDPVLVVEHSLDPGGVGSGVQNLSYTYDAIGNITAITDNAITGTGKRVTFAYDNLSRLLSASTTQASSTPFLHTFTYSPIGNMTGMATTGATTTYTYSETGSTNPSAPTSIGSGSLTYDTNGNLTAYNATKYTWDYRNRMVSTGNGVATTTFAYDHTYERVKKVFGATTTWYINDLYNKAGATTTKYIYDNGGVLLATIEGNGLSTTTQYQHQDHLGGTNVLTSAYGNVVTTLDYYPYGDTRIQSGTFTSKRNFIGEVSDAETDLNYLNARYYDSTRGQFVSQDPVFWEVGESDDGRSVLINPQAQNSYSYAQNNPIVYKDPSGRFIPAVFIPIIDGIATILTWTGVIQVASEFNDVRLQKEYPDQYTTQEREEAQSQLVYDTLSLGIGSKYKRIESIAFDVTKTVSDKIRKIGGQVVTTISKPDDISYVSTSATTVKTPSKQELTISAPKQTTKSQNDQKSSLTGAQIRSFQNQIKSLQKQVDKLKKEKSNKNNSKP